MRSRPKIALRFSGQARPGGSVHVAVSLTARSRTPVDTIRITFLGAEAHIPRGSFVPTEQEASVQPFSPPRDARGVIYGTPSRDIVAETRVLPARVLTPGTHTFDASFDIPADAPPSVVTASTYVEYRVHVAVIIPWWPDAIHHEPIEIAARDAPPAPGPAESAPPRRHTSHAIAEPGRVYLEAAIAPAEVEPGGTIAGAFAVSFPGRKPPRAVAVSIQAIEASRVFPLMKETVAFKTRTLRFDALTDGKTEPFEITLPRTFPTRLTTPFVEVTARAHLAAIEPRASDLELAIPIVVRHAPPAPASATLPLLGAARRGSAWEALAGHLQRRGLRIADADPARETLVATRAGLCVGLEAGRDARHERQLRFQVEGYFAGDETRTASIEAALDVRLHPLTGPSRCRGHVPDPRESPEVLLAFADDVVTLADTIAGALDAMAPLRDPASIPHLDDLRRVAGATFRLGDLAIANVFVDGAEAGVRCDGPASRCVWIAAPPLADPIVARVGEALGRPASRRSDRLELPIGDEDPRPLWSAAARALREALGATARSPYR